VRRYDELGLDVARTVAADDIALQLAYLPVLVADPSHYARWFRVTAKGQTVILSRGTDPCALLTRTRGTANVQNGYRHDQRSA